MGLFGAMTASVSGLGAQGQAISVISDNLANTNTIGYKASNTLFSQLVTNAGGGGSAYNSGGVGVSVTRDQSSQGSFISSGSKTDLAISGNGFFKVADSSTTATDTSYYYTRAGSFAEDKEGYLTNPDGFYLQGWKTDSDGNILDVQNPQAIELQSVGVSAQRTTEVSMTGNLTSTQDRNPLYATSGTLQESLDAFIADPTKADYVTDVRIYDAQGGARDMTLVFTKRADNLWDWQLATDGSNIQGGTTGTATRVASGTMEFTPTGGLKFATALTGTANPGSSMDIDVTWAGGVDPSKFALNLGDFTGGNVLSSNTSGLNYKTTNVPAITATTIANTTGFTSTGALTAGVYTLRRVDATHVALYDAANTAPVEVLAAAVSTTGAQTITFPTSGVTITTGSGFTMAALNDGDPIGTLTAGTAVTGGVLGISAENDVLPIGSYSLRKLSATTMGLFDSLGVQIGNPATVGASGIRDVYFADSQLRLTVSGDYDETSLNYPVTVGSFTLSPQTRQAKGIGTNGVTQLAASFNTKGINQNGFGAGTLAGIEVDQDGFVNGTFTNGETKKLYKVALAVFQNPRGLEAVSGSLLRVTESSGQALLKQAGIGGTGRLIGGSLEGSTTDIAGEFSNMIVAQRAFQASSKVITTVDQMLNDLLQLR